MYVFFFFFFLGIAWGLVQITTVLLFNKATVGFYHELAGWGLADPSFEQHLVLIIAMIIVYTIS